MQWLGCLSINVKALDNQTPIAVVKNSETCIATSQETGAVFA
jgi:hypothetical protein